MNLQVTTHDEKARDNSNQTIIVNGVSEERMGRVKTSPYSLGSILEINPYESQILLPFERNLYQQRVIIVAGLGSPYNPESSQESFRGTIEDNAELVEKISDYLDENHEIGFHCLENTGLLEELLLMIDRNQGSFTRGPKIFEVIGGDEDKVITITEELLKKRKAVITNHEFLSNSKVESKIGIVLNDSRSYLLKHLLKYENVKCAEFGKQQIYYRSDEIIQ